MKRLTDGRGVDVILDMIGASYLARNLKSLAPDGRLVMIALMGGYKVDGLNITPIMRNRLTFTGSTLRPRGKADKAAIAEGCAGIYGPSSMPGASGPSPTPRSRWSRRGRRTNSWSRARISARSF